MATATKKPETASVYDADFNQWAKDQARALSDRRTTGLDWDNLSEEIASLGRSDKREIENRLNVILVHLLKGKHQKELRTASWTATLVEQRQRIGKLLRESPSLRNYPADVLDEEYGLAVIKAAAETGLKQSSFPLRCPFTTEEVLDINYLPKE